jgi:hypothetical protein
MTAPDSASTPLITESEAFALNASSQTQTDQIMAALSVAEKLAAASPVAPTSLQISSNSFDAEPGCYVRPIGVELYFHLSVDKVGEFAGAFGADVRERPREGEWSLFTYADGLLDGVPFRAWTLTNEPVAQVAA